MELIKIGSLTAAQRASALLAVGGINSRRRRFTGSEGCAYGIEVSRRDFQRAVRILIRAGIAVQ